MKGNCTSDEGRDGARPSIGLARLCLALWVCLAFSAPGWTQEAAPLEGNDAALPQENLPAEAVPAEPEPAPEEPAPAPTVRPPRAVPRAPARPGRTFGAPPSGGVPVSPNRPKGGLVPGEPVALDFNNVKLMNVIEQIGIMTGQTLELDEQAIGLAEKPVTVISTLEIPPEMAYYVLESILASHGLKLIPTLNGRWTKIVPVDKKTPEKLPLVIGAEKEPLGYDSWSTYIVPVKYADASEVAQVLNSMKSEKGDCNIYAPTNTLIMTDTADGIRNMLEVLKQIDIPGYDTQMEIFTLEYTRAEVIQTQIQDVLLGPEGGVRQPGGQQAPRPAAATAVRRPAIPGALSQPAAFGSREETLRIVADERLNSLIVVATASLMERVRDLLDRLDTPTPYEANNMHVYELLNANAEDVENALNAFVGGTSSPRSSTRTGTGATGTPGGGVARPAGGSFGSGTAGGEGFGSDLQSFEKQVSIARYDQTNALLIVASPQDYKRLKHLIARLDVPQRQVNVDAVIMEVTISDSYELTTETTALTGNDGFALNNVVNLANVIVGGPLAATGSGVTAGWLRGTTKVPVTVGGVTVLQEIPNVPLLLKAVEKLTTVNVLSQPFITTVDNQEANVTIGQEVPTPAAINSGETGLVIQNRIERKEVGVKLKVKPQINEGDYVSMETEVEVSKPITSEIGIDPNRTGPTFQKSLIKNVMIIKDGYAGLMGGLLSESIDRTVSQPPILGDIPIVGWFLKGRSNKREKRNLIIVMTPYIIKEGVDYERITKSRLGDFNQANVDVVFEKGFINRIKKKHVTRTRSQPVIDRSETLLSGEGASRKNIQR